MSYILEALKKSQRERELGQVPTLVAAPSSPSPRASGRPWGLVAVGLASLAVAIALYAALHRGEIQTPSPPEIAGAAPGEQPSGGTPDAGAAPRSAVPAGSAQDAIPAPIVAPSQASAQTLAATESRRPETAIRGDVPPRARISAPLRRAPPRDALAASEPETETIETEDLGGNPVEEPASNDWMEMDEQLGPAEPAEPVEPPPVPRDTRPRRPSPPRATLPEPQSPPIPDDLRQDVKAFKEQLRRERSGAAPSASGPGKSAPADPTKLRLPLEVETRLPAFFMTAHVYDAEPAKRFVVINALRYIQGDTTREGLKVEEILPDGVVLGFEGHRFYKRR